MVLDHALSWLGTNLVSDISISLDFSHEANAPIISRHDGEICQYGSTEEIEMRRESKAKGMVMA